MRFSLVKIVKERDIDFKSKDPEADRVAFVEGASLEKFP